MTTNTKAVCKALLPMHICRLEQMQADQVYIQAIAQEISLTESK